MIIDGAADLKVLYFRASYHKDINDEDFKTKTVPTWLKFFEDLKKKNEGKWYVGNKLSIADIAVYYILAEMDMYCDGIVKKNNAILAQFLEDFSSQPKYAEYVKSSRYILDA